MSPFIRKFIKLTVALIVVCNYCNGQTIRPEVKTLAIEIAKDNVLKSRSIGIGGEKLEQWNRYEVLKNTATDEELKILAEDTNAVVRCYSFMALTNRKTIDIMPILIKHLYDNTIFKIHEDCSMGNQLTGDYFLNIVTSNYLDSNGYKLTDKEKMEVDSILIFDKNIRIEAKNKMLLKINSDEKYYERIREIVQSENNRIGLICLSKFRKQQDKQIIIEKLLSTDKDNKYYALLAVRNFSDTAFFLPVKTIHKLEINTKAGSYDYTLRILYQVIVQFRNKRSIELLDETLNTLKKKSLQKHSEFIWLAIQKYPDPIFQDILSRIKLTDDKKKELLKWLND